MKIPYKTALEKITDIPIEIHCLNKIINNCIAVAEDYNSKFSDELNWADVLDRKLCLFNVSNPNKKQNFWKGAKIFQGVKIRWKVKTIGSFFENTDNPKCLYQGLGILIKLLRGNFDLNHIFEEYYDVNLLDETYGIAFKKDQNKRFVISRPNFFFFTKIMKLCTIK